MNAFQILTRGVRFDRKKAKPQNNTTGTIDKSTVVKPVEDNVEAEVELDSNVHSPDEIREKYNIIVDGDDLVGPVTNFNDMQISDLLKMNLKKGGYTKPTPIQMQAIPLMLDDRQIIGSAPTGSGKTIAFLLPMIHHLKESKNVGFRAIVLAPTRELAKQIHRECIFLSEGTGLRVDLIKNTSLAKKKFNSNSVAKYDILITTPQRLEYLLKQDPPEINIENLEWLIIDECDRLFELTFRDQLSLIFNVCNRSKAKIRHAMFSATFDPNLEQWCRLQLDSVVTVVIGGKNKVAESVEQKLEFVGGEAGKMFALKEIINKGCQAPVLIFVSTIKKADYLQRELSAMKLPADCVHADRSQEYRDKIVRDFRTGKLPFLICTELMGRGIDFKAVNLVINYDFPSSPKAYIHHIGRTGRAGRRGLAITFYAQRDIEKLVPVLRIMRNSGCEVPEHLKTLNKRKLQEIEKKKRMLRNQREKRRRLAAKKKLEEGGEEDDDDEPNGNGNDDSDGGYDDDE